MACLSRHIELLVKEMPDSHWIKNLITGRWLENRNSPSIEKIKIWPTRDTFWNSDNCWKCLKALKCLKFILESWKIFNTSPFLCYVFPLSPSSYTESCLSWLTVVTELRLIASLAFRNLLFLVALDICTYVSVSRLDLVLKSQKCDHTSKGWSIIPSLSSSGPGPGQVQAKSRSGRSEIDLSLTIFLVFTTTTHPPPTQTFFLALEGSRHVRWT